MKVRSHHPPGVCWAGAEGEAGQWSDCRSDSYAATRRSSKPVEMTKKYQVSAFVLSLCMVNLALVTVSNFLTTTTQVQKFASPISQWIGNAPPPQILTYK